MGSPSLVAVRQVIAEISPIPLPGGFGITFFLMNERGLGWESKYMTISCRARSYSSQVPSVAWAPQFSRRCDKNCRCCLQISTPFTFYKGSLEVGNRYPGYQFRMSTSEGSGTWNCQFRTYEAHNWWVLSLALAWHFREDARESMTSFEFFSSIFDFSLGFPLLFFSERSLSQ